MFLVLMSILLVIAICAVISPTFRQRLERVMQHPLFRPACALGVCAFVAIIHPAGGLAMSGLFAVGALSESQHDTEFIQSECPGTISRDTVTVTVPAGTTYTAGRVLGQVAASGKYVAYDDASSDGREDAAGILVNAITNDGLVAADYDGVIINFGAEVREDDLVFEDGVDEDKAAGDLAALGVKVR